MTRDKETQLEERTHESLSRARHGRHAPSNLMSHPDPTTEFDDLTLALEPFDARLIKLASVGLDHLPRDVVSLYTPWCSRLIHRPEVAALRRLGWSLVAVPRGYKAPTLLSGWRPRAYAGLSDRAIETTDCNFAGATGQPIGWIVVDIEGEHSATWTAWTIATGLVELLAWVPQVRTPSGGTHLYFAYRPGIRTTKIKIDGVVVGDLKSDGGQCMLPPSVVYLDAHRYGWHGSMVHSLVSRALLADPLPGDTARAAHERAAAGLRLGHYTWIRHPSDSMRVGCPDEILALTEALSPSPDRASSRRGSQRPGSEENWLDDPDSTFGWYPTGDPDEILTRVRRNIRVSIERGLPIATADRSQALWSYAVECRHVGATGQGIVDLINRYATQIIPGRVQAGTRLRQGLEDMTGLIAAVDAEIEEERSEAQLGTISHYQIRHDVLLLWFRRAGQPKDLYWRVPLYLEDGCTVAGDWLQLAAILDLSEDPAQLDALRDYRRIRGTLLLSLDGQGKPLRILGSPPLAASPGDPRSEDSTIAADGPTTMLQTGPCPSTESFK